MSRVSFLFLFSCTITECDNKYCKLFRFSCFYKKRTLFSSCTFSYHDNNIKQGTISALGEPSKTNPFLAGGILYPCTSTSGRNTLQRQLTNDSRLLWATLTPHGTRHFISDYAGGFPPDATATTDNGAITEDISSNPEKSNKVANPEVNPGHYEIVDYRGKMQMHNFRDYIKGTPVKVRQHTLSLSYNNNNNNLTVF